MYVIQLGDFSKAGHVIAAVIKVYVIYVTSTESMKSPRVCNCMTKDIYVIDRVSKWVHVTNHVPH